MKISRNDLFALVQAIGALAGRPVEASDGDKKTVIVKPYDIDGTARYAFARMKAAAKNLPKEIEDEREALVAKSGLTAEELDKDKSSPKFKEFKKALDAFCREDIDFTEHRVKIDTLKIGTNQLDPSIIEALLPILDGAV